MFRITSETGDDELVMKLEGALVGPFVPELHGCWRAAVENAAGRPIRVDLTDVCHVDAAGQELMARMFRAGARFVASGCVMPEIVREISESALPGIQQRS
jgi:ABC-type transporter Mla MlaB component